MHMRTQSLYIKDSIGKDNLSQHVSLIEDRGKIIVELARHGDHTTIMENTRGPSLLSASLVQDCSGSS